MKKFFRINPTHIIDADDIETIRVEPDGDKFAVIVYFFNKESHAHNICNKIWEELSA